MPPCLLPSALQRSASSPGISQAHTYELMVVACHPLPVQEQGPLLHILYAHSSAHYFSVVNCQNGVGTYETLFLEPHSDGTKSILSSQFANVYVRMDGSNVLPPPTGYPNGSPTVNAQVQLVSG